MRRTMRSGLLACACALGAAALVDAQSGATEWTTSAFDAQRTRWVRSDTRLTKDAVKAGELQFLWKSRFANETRQLHALAEPILQDWLIGFRGFKSLAFVGGSADRLFAIDTDLARVNWTVHLNYAAATGGQPPSSWECPGGLMATPSRRTPLAPSAFGGGGGGGGSGAVSAVGEPGQGAAILEQRRKAASAAPRPAPPEDVPPPSARRSAASPIPFGGVDPLYVVATDGLLRTLRVSDGSEMSPSVPFLPPSAKPSSLIFVDGLVYTTTSNGCGAAPNALWAIDTVSDDKKVVTWKTHGANVAGTSGPAFGTTGTLYVAVATGTTKDAVPPRATNGAKGPASYADSVVALDRQTLEPKDWFTAEGADFNATPTVVRYKDRDLVAVTANDGRLYLLDGASLGGADHKTPLFVTPKYTAAGATGGLATWEGDGTRWILAPVQGAVPASAGFTAHGAAPRGSIVAFEVTEKGGKMVLEPAWQSRDLVSPLAPVVVNGLVFAAGSGEYRGSGKTAAGGTMTAAQRAQRSVPAVLVALDGATGAQMWTSGPRMTSFARAGLSAGGGRVYVVTYDNHLYAFGIPMEH